MKLFLSAALLSTAVVAQKDAYDSYDTYGKDEYSSVNKKDSYYVSGKKDSDYGKSNSNGGYDKDKCRYVKQERPVCHEVKRQVKREFKLEGEKQKCSFKQVPVHRQVKVEVKTDSCKPKIITKKNSRPVHINNKVCEYDDKDKKKKPICRIVKETKYIDSYDRVTNWHCDTHIEHETIKVQLHVPMETCHPVPINEKKVVVVDIKEKKCHVEKFTREVCDNNGKDVYSDGKGDYGVDDGGKFDKERAYISTKEYGHSKGYGSDAYGKDYGHSKGYGGDSYGKDSYGGHSKGGGDSYGKDSYGGHSKGYGGDSYGKDSYGDSYGTDYGHSKGYGGDSYGKDYGYSKGYGGDSYGKDSYGDNYGKDYGHSKGHGDSYGNEAGYDSNSMGY